MNKFKIKVGQAYNFYKIIGTEDKNSIAIDKENEIKKMRKKKIWLNKFKIQKLQIK